MIGRNPGCVTTPGEILSDHFEARRYHVISVSSAPNRYLRLADIVTNLIRHRHRMDIILLQVYGERSFVV